MGLFPRTEKYDPAWVRQNSLGENVLYNLESLCNVLPLKPGQRVLDLGCGNAISSIFLAKEFGVIVWALDKDVSPEDNWRRIQKASCLDCVIPIQSDARKLELPEGYFDVIIAANSIHYYGIDDSFIPYILSFLKPKGCLGIVDYCFSRDPSTGNGVPPSIKKTVQMYWRDGQSLGWWQQHLERNGLAAVEHNEYLPETQAIWNAFIADFKDSAKGSDQDMVTAIQADQGDFVRLFRAVARRH